MIGALLRLFGVRLPSGPVVPFEEPPRRKLPKTWGMCVCSHPSRVHEGGDGWCSECTCSFVEVEISGTKVNG